MLKYLSNRFICDQVHHSSKSLEMERQAHQRFETVEKRILASFGNRGVDGPLGEALRTAFDSLIGLYDSKVVGDKDNYRPQITQRTLDLVPTGTLPVGHQPLPLDDFEELASRMDSEGYPMYIYDPRGGTDKNGWYKGQMVVATWNKSTGDLINPVLDQEND